MKLRTTISLITLLLSFISINNIDAQEFSIGHRVSKAVCNGQLYAAGQDVTSTGMLGFGPTVTNLFYYTQSPFSFGSPVKKVISRYRTTLILLQNGNVYSYGDNNWGQLGIGNTLSKDTPTRVKGVNCNGYLENIIDIDLDGLGRHSVAVDNQGRVIEWGITANNSIDSIPNYVISSINQLPLTNIIKATISSYASAALDVNGNVWVWGNNIYVGLLGLGAGYSNFITEEAVQNPNLSHIKDVEGGDGYFLALKNDGTLWSWGNNDLGRLGDGTTLNRDLPVQVIGGGNAGGIGFFQNAKKIKCGYMSSFVIKDDGTLWSWGSNHRGVLNNQNIPTSLYSHTSIPVQVEETSGNGYMQNVEDVFPSERAVIAKQQYGRGCRFIVWGEKRQMGYGSDLDFNSFLPEEMQVNYLNCCGLSISNNSFSSFVTDKTTICPDTCVTLNAQVGTGNPTVDNWVVYGASSISNASGLSTEVCFDTPGTYNVFVQTNGNANIINTGIQITVLPENSRYCQFDSNDNDNNTNRLVKNGLIDEAIKVFPNPSSAVFNIQSNGLEIEKYEVKNIYGKQIKAIKIKKSNKAFQIDLSNENTGIYFISVYSSEGIQTLKLIKN